MDAGTNRTLYSTIAVLVAAVAGAAYGWALDLAGIPLRAGPPGATEAKPIPIASFAWGTAVLAIVALGIAAVLRRRGDQPRHTFVVVTAILAVVSLALPLAAGATSTSTKLTFALGHLVLAAIIIPFIARDLQEA